MKNRKKKRANKITTKPKLAKKPDLFDEAYEIVMKVEEVEADEIVKTFVRHMNTGKHGGVMTALDLLPDLWHLPSFAAIQSSDRTDEAKTRLAKAVLDEALVQMQGM